MKSVITEQLIEKILKYVKKYQNEKRTSPSYRMICNACNIKSTQTVSKIMDMLYENGELDYIVYDSKKHISVPNDLTTLNSKMTPIVGKVACGTPITAAENIECTISLPVDIFGNKDKYIVTAKGYSMDALGIDDGDLLVVEQTQCANIGDVIIARVNVDEVTAKILARDKKGRYYLKPASTLVEDDGTPKFKDIYPEGDINICGIVRNVIKKIKPQTI